MTTLFAFLLFSSICFTACVDICTLTSKYSKFKASFDAYFSHKDSVCETHFHHDCAKILKTFPTVKSDVYVINLGDKGRHFPAFCDMGTDGGGWMVIQRRISGSETFDRPWLEYRTGFGNLTGDFWLGNSIIHRVTSDGNWELRIDLTQKDGTTGYAKYESFSVGDQSSFYRLSVNGYSGTIGDSLSSYNGMKFSASDFDLDTSSTSCALQTKGGWWFADCAQSTLNGYYNSSSPTSHILWKTWHSKAVISSDMMIRPHSLQICHDKVNAMNWCLGKAIGKDCSDILKKSGSAADGVYTIDPDDGQGPFQAYCDMTTDGGGWVVFQRRTSGTENFYRTWNEYKTGFGNLSGEFYLGNENIHRLSSESTTTLRVDLEDFNHNTAYATYNNFVIGSVADNYKLTFGAYNGTAGDSLSYSNGMAFTAKDKDLDQFPENCAQSYHGAWWYRACHKSNLNGHYNDTNHGEGINWLAWRGYDYSLYRTEMKIKPQS